ncbi:Exonuclease SbcC [Clostridiaceae bacterium BL-3]|nr:Exonuclease SbcC [Clostridiaceae bacterium BL-3]
MEENTIPFVVKLKEYIDQRNSRISEKKALIADLRSQLQSKNAKISELEAEYKQTFDDAVFEKLVQYKKDVDSIQDSINKVSEIISLMGTGKFQYSLSDLQKEIDSYIEKVGLDDLKKSIVEVKEKYLNLLDDYENKLCDIYALRYSINIMDDDVSKEIKDKVINTLNKHSKEYHCTDDMFINSHSYEDIQMRLNRSANNIYL